MLVFAICSYLFGAIPFGYLAGRARGVDLREHGSRNIGATNALRVLGKPIGIAVFLCDFTKGFLPVFLWKEYGTFSSGWDLNAGLVIIGLSAILGHTYTCFLHFRGGKGVSTAAGVLFAISPIMGAVSLAAWFIFLLAFRYVSLASMLASVLMVCMGFYVFGFFDPGGWAWRPEWVVMLFLILVALLVIVKHRSNVIRMAQGIEPKAFSGGK